MKLSKKHMTMSLFFLLSLILFSLVYVYIYFNSMTCGGEADHPYSKEEMASIYEEQESILEIVNSEITKIQ